MKRDESGKVEIEYAGEVEKFYPPNCRDNAVFWTCQRVKIRTELLDNAEKAIIAFEFVRGPHKIICDGKTYESDSPENFPEYIKTVLEQIDVTSNCFGYAFLNGPFWVDPLIDCLIYKIPVIQNILESDHYKKIESPIANSIALFGKNGDFRHASITTDGKTWYSKNGIHKFNDETLEGNIEKFGEVKYFMKD